MKKIGAVLMLLLMFIISGCGDSGDSSSSSSNSLISNEPNTTETTQTAEEDADAPFQFTKEFLEGKTLYMVENDDFGYDELLTDWNMASLTFSDEIVIFKEYDMPTDKEGVSFPYRVEENGSITIIFPEEDGSEFNWIVSPIDKNDTAILAVDNESAGDNIYFFFDEESAKSFRDAKNSESSISGFSKELLDKKGFYYVEQKTANGDDNSNVEWSLSKIEFNDNQMSIAPIYQEEDTSIFTYSIEDNGSTILATNSENGLNLIFKFEKSYTKAIHVKVGESDSDNVVDIKDFRDGYFFYNKEIAEVFVNAQNGVEEED